MGTDSARGSERPQNTVRAAAATGEILVVDDNPANLLAMEAALSGIASRLVKAQSGDEALRHILERDFALILLDVQMPGLNGFETAKIIRSRERSRHVPIIFVTAFHREESEILKGYTLGAVDFLFKPIVPDMLRAKASVFVELQRSAAEIMQQAQLLREHERREHERTLEHERQRWEATALRVQMEEQRRVAKELAQRAEALTRTVGQLEKVEEELKRTNAELALADQRKDEFLAILAHELRNPLAPIVAGLELIGEHELSNPIHRRARAIIQRQASHLTRLVDDLLDVARITSGKIELRKEHVDINVVIEQAVTTSRPVILERRHELSVACPPSRVFVDADPVRLTQVFANLLNNAARYTDPGGHIELVCSKEAEHVVVRVSDNGHGIPPHLIDRIFDMFVQNRAGGGGLGLGLTLVQRLVNLHDGTVTAFSPGEGLGSTFEIRLPFQAEGAASDRSNEREPTNASVVDLTERIHIVIIEDNEDIRDMLRHLLEAWGHRVDSAADGMAGVDLVRRVHPQIALIDIGMPGLDGYGVASRLRAEFDPASLRLVAMTGFGQDHDRARAFQAGFETHLVKPVSPQTLRRVLSTR